MPDSLYFIKWFIIYPLAIQLTLLVLSKYAPYKNPPKYNREDAKKAIKKFGNIDLFISGFLLVCMFVMAYILTLLLLQGQAQYLGSYAPDKEYAIGFNQWGYSIPAFLLTGAAAQFGFSYIMEVVRYLKRATKKELSIYLLERTPFGHSIDQWKLGRITVFILTPISLLWILLGLNTYTLIDHTGLTYNKFLSFEEEHHSMNEITGIYQIHSYLNKKSKKIVSTRPYYSVTFSDGFTWKTNNTSLPESKKDVEVMNYISNESQVSIKKGVGNIDN